MMTAFGHSSLPRTQPTKWIGREDDRMEATDENGEFAVRRSGLRLLWERHDINAYTGDRDENYKVARLVHEDKY